LLELRDLPKSRRSGGKRLYSPAQQGGEDGLDSATRHYIAMGKAFENNEALRNQYYASRGWPSVPAITPTPDWENYKSIGTLTPFEAQYGYPMVKWAREELLSDKYSYWPPLAGLEYYPPGIGDQRPIGDWVLDTIYNGALVRDTYDGKIPLVCADIVDLAYFSVNIDLQTIPTRIDYPNRFPRSSYGLENMLTYSAPNNLHTWGDGTVPELGDIFLLENEISNSDQDSYHAGLITQVHGTTADKIWVLETSGEHKKIVEITVEELLELANENDNLLFGHPNVP